VPHRKRSSPLPVYLAIGGGLLLLVVAILLATQSGSPTAAPTLASSGGAVGGNPEIARVTLSDAKAAFDANSAVFLDVRDTDSYSISHIPGAKNIPLANLLPRLGELDKTQWIITY
jgi:hypothetical protein